MLLSIVPSFSQMRISAGVAITNLKHASLVPAFGPQASGAKYWKSRPGFYIEGQYDLALRNKNGMSFGLGCIQAGAKSEDFKDQTLKLYYLTIPVSFYFKPVDRLKIAAGVQANVLMKEDPSYQFPLNFNVEDNDLIDGGILLSADFKVLDHVSISARQYIGLKYNNETTFDHVVGGLPDINTNRNIFLTVGLTYLF